MSIASDLAGKTALVTGGGRGLGKAVALAFAEAGADVYIGNRKKEEGNQTVSEIVNMGRRSGFSRCDVSVDADVKHLVEDAVEFGSGTLNCLVNVAGVISTDDFMLTTDEEIRRIFDINVIGTQHVLKYGLQVMQKQGFGNIETFSSIAGRGGMGMLPMYCATKAAVINMTQSAAKNAAPYGIRVNSIAPGIIRTNMWEEILDGMANGGDPKSRRKDVSEEEREALWQDSVKSLIPLGRAQKPEDIAYAAVFIASDLAREITGQVIAIDGGTTMTY